MELSEALFGLLHGLKHRISQQLKQSDLDLSIMHLKSLKMISNIDDCTGQKMAAFIGRDKAQINRLIKELVKQELVIKTHNENDGRSQILTVSQHGQALIIKFNQIEQQVFNKMINEVAPEDVASFIQLAKVFGNNLK